MTQTEIILTHLRGGKAITSMQAFYDYGITRLAARIKDLRRKGYIIRTERVTNGESTFAAYHLEADSHD